MFVLSLSEDTGVVNSVPTKQLISTENREVKVHQLKWSGRDTTLPFYLVDLAREGLLGDSQEKFLTDCQTYVPNEFCAFLFESPRRVREVKDAQLFLVPIFESVLYTQKGLYNSVNLLRKQRYFMKFRGSDFVFLCYTTNCDATRMRVVDALGRGVRAMWVDRSGTDPWPCSNRKIAVDVDETDVGRETNWTAESARLEKILHRAGDLIKGRTRWSCESTDTWGLNSPSLFDFATIKDTSFKSVKDKVAYCGVPKVGSSVAVLLMRRMNGIKDWKQSNTVQIRNFHTGHNWTYEGKEDMIRIFDDTQWAKGMLVRNPITRLLSGYRSKIIDLHEYMRIPGGWPKGSNPPSLKQFVEKMRGAKARGHLDWTDRHFRPQSALCGVRTLPYDFIGRYEERQEDMHGFLDSVELWEKLGAYGWGVNGTSSLYAEDEHIIRRNKPKPVTHADSKSIIREYYTRDLIKAVIQLYDEDFTRFGFSKNVDDYL